MPIGIPNNKTTSKKSPKESLTTIDEDSRYTEKLSKRINKLQRRRADEIADVEEMAEKRIKKINKKYDKKVEKFKRKIAKIDPEHAAIVD